MTTYCLNPTCHQSQKPCSARFCQACGSVLCLKERYKANRLIGQGGFGKTFLATDEDKPSKPYCVIKQLHINSQNSENVDKVKELFGREAIQLDKLGKHPQIPELLAYLNQDGYLYLV